MMDKEELLDADFIRKPAFEGWTWWQKRRGVYTIVITLAMLVMIGSYWIPGFERKLAYIFLAVMITLLCANLAYSLPLLIEWSVYQATNGKYQLEQWRTPLFWIGGLFSLFVAVICAEMIAREVIVALIIGSF